MPGRAGVLVRTMSAMGKHSVERKLRKAGARLRTLRDELVVIDEQLAHLVEDAEAEEFEGVGGRQSGRGRSTSARPPEQRGDGRASASCRRRDRHVLEPVRTNYSMNFAYSDPCSDRHADSTDPIRANRLERTAASDDSGCGRRGRGDHPSRPHGDPRRRRLPGRRRNRPRESIDARPRDRSRSRHPRHQDAGDGWASKQRGSITAERICGNRSSGAATASSRCSGAILLASEQLRQDRARGSARRAGEAMPR